MENKDLMSGDCHLIASARSHQFVALCVCVDAAGKVVLSALKQSLRSLAQKARKRNATVHCPHLNNWF
jgi:hypothetical protein